MDNQHIKIGEVREKLYKLFRTDADFVAFILDYFPNVYQRLSDGMDRLAKENLLLAIIEPSSMLEALDRYCKRSHPHHTRSTSTQNLVLILGGFILAGLILVRELHRWRSLALAGKANDSGLPNFTTNSTPSVLVPPSPLSEQQPVRAYVTSEARAPLRAEGANTVIRDRSRRPKRTNPPRPSADDLAEELSRPPPLK